jgi:LmbE family N-acetylglucosaminyl deacetylase
MSNPPGIVAVGAHAADMEFTAGATLLKHARAGWAAHLIHLTLGEKGNPRLTPEAYGAQKKQEAEEAAQKLNATPHFLPYLDGELPASDDVAREVAILLRRLQPQVVIAHWRGSIHTDHINAYHLTRRATFMAAIPHFDLEGLPPARGMQIYYAENWEDPDGYHPYVYVDISDVFADWEQAFKCYAIGRGEGGFPYWDWYQARTRIRGIEIGTMYAQTFAVDEWRMRLKKDLL